MRGFRVVMGLYKLICYIAILHATAYGDSTQTARSPEKSTILLACPSGEYFESVIDAMYGVLQSTVTYYVPSLLCPRPYSSGLFRFGESHCLPSNGHPMRNNCTLPAENPSGQVCDIIITENVCIH